MIPRTIIQFWHDPDAMPEIIRNATRQTRELHSDYQYVFADDRFMQTHIMEHYDKATLALYNRIQIPAARSDLARLMLLHHYGGSYLDCSLRLFGRLESILYDADEIVLVKRDDEPQFRDIPDKARVTNSFISAPARSGYIHWCIRRVLGNLVDGDYNNRVALATGPQVLNMGVLRLEDRYRIRYLRFSELRGDFLKFSRQPGVNNSWLITQNEGILDKAYMRRKNLRWRGLWRFNRTFIHLSCGILRVTE